MESEDPNSTHTLTNTTSPPESGGRSPSKNVYILIIVRLVPAVLIIFGNLCVLVVTPKLKKTKRSPRYIIVNIGVADLITGLNVFVGCVVNFFPVPNVEGLLCWMKLLSLPVCANNVLYSVLLLTLDVSFFEINQR